MGPAAGVWSVHLQQIVGAFPVASCAVLERRLHPDPNASALPFPRHPPDPVLAARQSLQYRQHGSDVHDRRPEGWLALGQLAPLRRRRRRRARPPPSLTKTASPAPHCAHMADVPIPPSSPSVSSPCSSAAATLPSAAPALPRRSPRPLPSTPPAPTRRTSSSTELPRTSPLPSPLLGYHHADRLTRSQQEVPGPSEQGREGVEALS